MSIARAIVWPGSFNDPTLPKVDLSYTPPLPGAAYSWAADNLQVGELQEWIDSVRGIPMKTDAGAPAVFQGGLFRAIRFNGTDDRMRTLFPVTMAGAHSVVAVYRLTSAAYGDAVFSDHQGLPGAGQITVDSNGNYVAYTDNTYIYSTPPLAANNAWRVAVLTRDGNASAMRINDAETVGNLSSNIARRGIALGYSTRGDNRAAIEVARVDVIPGAMEPAQRAAIVNSLRARYGI